MHASLHPRAARLITMTRPKGSFHRESDHYREPANVLPTVPSQFPSKPCFFLCVLVFVCFFSFFILGPIIVLVQTKTVEWTFYLAPVNPKALTKC